MPRWSRRRTILWLGAALCLLLAVMMPLRVLIGTLGLQDRGFAARAVDGSVWSGRLAEAHWGPLHLGTLDVGLRPLPLLLGRASVDIAAPADPRGLAGRISVSPGGFGVAGLRGMVPIRATMGSLPVESLVFDRLSVAFASRRCVAASGRATLMLGGQIAGVTLTRGLSGTARCEGNDLVLPLTSDSGMERLNLRVDRDGRYTATLGVTTSDPLVAAALTLAGFHEAGGGMQMRMSGRLTP